MFHAPWLGPGDNGRDFLAGLTRGKNSTPGELGPDHKSCWQNWSLILFNDVGGYTLGKIWKPVTDKTGAPDLAQLPFRIGAVMTKFLFSEAPADEVPQLRGSPTVRANIPRRFLPDAKVCAPIGGERTPKTLRLMQVDVAVRDPRADQFTGWVFASFGFDGRLSGKTWQARLRPLGLTWGNDPALSDKDAADGRRPRESVVLWNYGLDRPLGRGGRMNGPADSQKSSCLSCHGTVQLPNAAPLLPPDNAAWAVTQCWFRNLSPSVPFGLFPPPREKCGKTSGDIKFQSTDYSFAVAIGVLNWMRYGDDQPAGIETYSQVDRMLERRSLQRHPLTRSGN